MKKEKCIECKKDIDPESELIIKLSNADIECARKSLERLEAIYDL